MLVVAQGTLSQAISNAFSRMTIAAHREDQRQLQAVGPRRRRLLPPPAEATPSPSFRPSIASRMNFGAANVEQKLRRERTRSRQGHRHGRGADLLCPASLAG